MSADIIPIRKRRREPAYYSTRPTWNHDGWILPFPRTFYDHVQRQWELSDTRFTFPDGPDEAA